MFQYIIELIFGLISGILFGITGIPGLPLLHRPKRKMRQNSLSVM